MPINGLFQHGETHIRKKAPKSAHWEIRRKRDPRTSRKTEELINRHDSMQLILDIVPLSLFDNYRILSTSQSTQKEVTVAPLIEQRKNRPLSPHLTIYQPQITWYMSGFHRFTGGAVAAGKACFAAKGMKAAC